MNPTEIADALDALAKQPFDAEAFGIAFAEATDNPQATLAKLRNGTVNKSDLPGGVLLNRKFHYAPAAAGQVEVVTEQLRASKKTASAKPAILLATDGESIAAEHPKSGETLHCAFGELGTRFAFFLPAAGKDRYQAAEENPVDIKATGKLAKLYDALLKTNPNWATSERRHDMNLFMTRLIFCLFAEDVGVFPQNQFSHAIFSFSGDKGEHARDVLVQAFTAMNLPKGERPGLTAWTATFEYVNGGLFSGVIDAPVFDPLAFRYLRDAANLNWKLINPDIFGSMIQSIADAGMRSELGMHYTSVPNIMKVLGPLFLDDLDAAIEKVWDRPAPLRVQLARLSKIRVFDPACGSGNFLVVAYRELREREIRIVKQLGELEANPQNVMWSSVSLSQFHGIEITDFAAETAKLALFIAEYQANARFADVFGQMPALLPLRDGGHIVCGNALRLDWEKICAPPVEGEEVYIAGNPPFLGKAQQDAGQKADMDYVFGGHLKTYRAFDLVSAWYFKASRYIRGRNAKAALVSTNSICQGASASGLWPEILKDGVEIGFAHRSFKWRNNASANAAVICVVVGMRNRSSARKRIFDNAIESAVGNINAYLLDGANVFVRSESVPGNNLPEMNFGCMPYDDGHLRLSESEREDIISECSDVSNLIRVFCGSKELINGLRRYCVWIGDDQVESAKQFSKLWERVEATRIARLGMKDLAGKALADRPHQFREHVNAVQHSILVPSISSENRPYLPVEIVGPEVVSSNKNFVIYDGPDWAVSLIASKLHLVWAATVCGRLKSDFQYSNTIGWNTFPVPKFTDEQLDRLSISARRILKTRYQHFPATLAELYAPDQMPDDLRQAHTDNDHLLEAMYIGRPFRNDTERLETLFKLYAARTAGKGAHADG